jgi:hypothetical protein
MWKQIGFLKYVTQRTLVRRYKYTAFAVLPDFAIDLQKALLGLL